MVPRNINNTIIPEGSTWVILKIRSEITYSEYSDTRIRGTRVGINGI